jgi:DHHC palmitoyltransferase
VKVYAYITKAKEVQRRICLGHISPSCRLLSIRMASNLHLSSSTTTATTKKTRMNNCIGVNNLKHFILFLMYTWIGSVLALIIFAVNYFFCNSSECQFNDNAVEISLVRVMTFICIVTVMFTSSMLMNVIYGITTGIGTIDRLKKKSDDQWHLAMEEPIPLRDIVGISTSRITVAGGEQTVVIARLADWWWWFLPVDPQFDDYDRVMGYATAVRLLREQQQQQQQSSPSLMSSSRRFPASTTATGAAATTTCTPVTSAAAAAPVLPSPTTMSSSSSSGPRGTTQASV